MATVVALMAKQRGGPKIRFQTLFYPVTDANFDTQSYRDLAVGYFLTRENMKWFWNSYLPDENKRKEPTASPLQATIDQLKGLPSALLIVGEFDPLRSEVEAYAHKLVDAGVQVTAIRMLGTTHDFATASRRKRDWTSARSRRRRPRRPSHQRLGRAPC